MLVHILVGYPDTLYKLYALFCLCVAALRKLASEKECLPPRHVFDFWWEAA